MNDYSITLEVSSDELERRRKDFKPVVKPVSGYLGRYAKLVSSADKGAIFED